MRPAKTIAVIPARGGSKRIPHKNIKAFCGKPMLAYSIEAAIRSQLFDRIIVSTDDKEIAEVAGQYGAEVPFERPPELSDDHTPTLPVIRHAIKSIEAQQQSKLDQVCCIYATAPFLTAPDLVKGYDCLSGKASLDFAFSVTNYAFPIQRALYVDSAADTVKMFYPEHANTRSQNLKEAYHDAGQFYWGRRDAFMDCDHIFSALASPVVLSRMQVQDIDTPEDWDCAEQLYRLQLQKKCQ